MYSRIFIFISLIFLLLSACTQTSQQKPELTEPPSATSAPSPIVQEIRSSPDAGGQDPGCRIKGPQPTPDATQQALLPLANEEDWIKGPKDAYVTIVEYGDFQ